MGAVLGYKFEDLQGQDKSKPHSLKLKGIIIDGRIRCIPGASLKALVIYPICNPLENK